MEPTEYLWFQKRDKYVVLQTDPCHMHLHGVKSQLIFPGSKVRQIQATDGNQTLCS